MCDVSPLLFNIYMVLDRSFEKQSIGGIKIENRRVWSLTYTDDIVTKNREKRKGVTSK